MVPHETKMFLHIRGHCHSTEEKAYRIRKKNYQWYIWKRIDVYIMKKIQRTKQHEIKQLLFKNGDNLGVGGNIIETCKFFH